jgi:hypothetical protein
MSTNPGKALVNNSGERTVGVEVFLDQIVQAEPFASLFPIREETLAAIAKDMADNGFDVSKPVNLWKKPDGSKILIDGYTRILAARQCGLLRVTASERDFADEDSALSYAIHTQRDRRNLDDATLLVLVQRIDHRQAGQRIPLAPRGANESSVPSSEPTGDSLAPRGANEPYPAKTAQITAELVGVSTRTVERARTVLSNENATSDVLSGKATIARAAREVTEADKSREQSPAGVPSTQDSRLVLKVRRETRERLKGLWDSLNLTEEQGLWKAVQEFALSRGTEL